MHIIKWVKLIFTQNACDGCIAREHEIARLIEENRELRRIMNEVIDSQKTMLRDLLKLNQTPKQNVDRETNPLQMRKLSTIQSKISEAEKRDREEYNKRIAAES